MNKLVNIYKSKLIKRETQESLQYTHESKEATYAKCPPYSFYLDCLKVIAIFHVLLGHFVLINVVKGLTPSITDTRDWMKVYLFDCLYAVDIFLWVSGYLFGLKYGGLRRNYFATILLRVKRLYPMFIVVFLVYVLQKAGRVDNLLHYLLLVSNITGTSGHFEWIWYIEIDIQIFIIILLTFGFLRTHNRNVVLALLLLLQWLGSISACLINGYSVPYYSLTEGSYYSHFYQLPWFRMGPFLIGALAARLRLKQNSLLRIAGVFLVLIAFIGWYPLIHHKNGWANYFAPIFEASGRNILSVGLSLINFPRTQSHLVLNSISNLTYPIYLIHYMVFDHLLEAKWAVPLTYQFASSTSIIVLLSWLFARGIKRVLETPGNGLRRS